MYIKFVQPFRVRVLVQVIIVNLAILFLFHALGSSYGPRELE